MKRHDLEHLIRAASAITNEYEFLIIGSQSILGAYPEAPDELLISREADIAPYGLSWEPERLSDLIDGTIGEDSPFDKNYGYYAQGVSQDTAVLPAGWKDRLVRVQSRATDMKIGYCLEPHDLAIAKLVAGREKDHHFVRALLSHGLVGAAVLRERLQNTPVSKEHRSTIDAWIQRNTPEARSRPRP